jgi:hypothetical protein
MNKLGKKQKNFLLRIKQKYDKSDKEDDVLERERSGSLPSHCDDWLAYWFVCNHSPSTRGHEAGHSDITHDRT